MQAVGSAVLVPAEDRRDNTALVLLRLAPTGVPWRVPVPAWPDMLHRQQANHEHTHTPEPKAAHSSKEYHSKAALL